MDNFSKSLELKLFRVCRLMNKVQMKRTVLYGTARKGDYLIVAVKKLQSVPFQGPNDCRLATVCANEKQRNIWWRAQGRQMLPSHPMQ